MSCGKFSGKIPSFSLPWQRGSSEQSLTDTIKLTDPDNPLVGLYVQASGGIAAQGKL